MKNPIQTFDDSCTTTTNSITHEKLLWVEFMMTSVPPCHDVCSFNLSAYAFFTYSALQHSQPTPADFAFSLMSDHWIFFPAFAINTRFMHFHQHRRISQEVSPQKGKRKCSEFYYLQYIYRLWHVYIGFLECWL